jgi:hypothetical protein
VANGAGESTFLREESGDAATPRWTIRNADNLAAVGRPAEQSPNFHVSPQPDIIENQRSGSLRTEVFASLEEQSGEQVGIQIGNQKPFAADAEREPILVNQRRASGLEQ